MNKAEELIACLEGEIAKRDEELAACRVAVENCEVFRARIAELEALSVTKVMLDIVPGDGDGYEVYAKSVSDVETKLGALGEENEELQFELDQLRAELAAIKAQGVALDGSQLAGLLEQVRLDDDEAKPHGSGATYWNNAVIACQVAIRDALAAPVQQVSVQGGLELIKRMQVCLSLDDTEWGLSAPEKYKLLGDIKSYVLAAPAAPAADAGLVAVEWAKDAEEWGPALNAAGWLFLSELNEDPQKSALIFNNCKGPLRAAIMKYAEIVTAHSSKGVV